MKSLCLLIVVLLVNGCEDLVMPDVVQYEKELIFRPDKTYSSNDNQLKFAINEVRDSRCPKGVWCVWQGEAVVKITTELPVIDTIELSTFDHLMDSVGNFSFELLDVSPYPVYPDTIEQEEYKIKLKIEKLGED